MKTRKSMHSGSRLCLALSSAPLLGYTQAAQAAATEVLSAGTMLQFALGLGIVLALIVAAGWVMKKSTFGKSAPGMIKVIAGAAVGQRERVVVVEVGDVRMVLGVAPGRVTALHTMSMSEPREEQSDPANAADADTAGAAVELKAWLQDNTVPQVFRNRSSLLKREEMRRAG
jgi:flagellar protein FliO/FliZ